MIRQGTTPTKTFSVNADLRTAAVFITFVQNEKVLITKTGEDLTITETAVSCDLTQAETLKLSPEVEVEIQIAYVMENGTADRSNIMRERVEKAQQREVIEYA